MKIKPKYIKRIILISFLLVIIDLSTIIYNKLFYKPGSWPNFYSYDKSTPKELIMEIEKLKNKGLSITYIPDTRKYPSHYTQVVFFDRSSSIYYHSWVLVDTIDSKNFTQIVFGFIGKTDNFEEGKRVNVDYDLISNYFVTKQFENLVINRIKLKISNPK